MEKKNPGNGRDKTTLLDCTLAYPSNTTDRKVHKHLARTKAPRLLIVKFLK